MGVALEGGEGKRKFGVVGGNVLPQHANLEFPEEVEGGKFTREGGSLPAKWRGAAMVWV